MWAKFSTWLLATAWVVGSINTYSNSLANHQSSHSKQHLIDRSPTLIFPKNMASTQASFHSNSLQETVRPLAAFPENIWSDRIAPFTPDKEVILTFQLL